MNEEEKTFNKMLEIYKDELVCKHSSKVLKDDKLINSNINVELISSVSKNEF